MIRQAVILAAGKGTRMKKGQSDIKILSTPKPLLEINGIPIIQRTVEKLVRDGIKVALVINPSDSDKFSDILCDFDVDYYYQSTALGTANALQCAREFVTDDLFAVFMGDDIFNYEDLNLLTINRPTVFGFEVNDVSNYGVIVPDSDSFAKEIIEKKLKGRGLVNTGIYVFHREFFNIYPKIESNDTSGEYFLTDAIAILYKSGRPLEIKKINLWKGINTIEDLRFANGVIHE